MNVVSTGLSRGSITLDDSVIADESTFESGSYAEPLASADSSSNAPKSASQDDGPPSTQIGQTLHDLISTLNRRKAQLAGASAENWTTRSLLYQVASNDASRVTTIAENLGADPSTVSRQVATLVTKGLLERLADPGDGRASVLALTAAGQDRFEASQLERADWINRLLSGWAPDDIATFAELFTRFTNAIEEFRVSATS